MQNKGEIKLYNVMFPLWLLVYFPISWIVVLPANFIIDSIVLLIAIKVLKLENMKLIYKKSIIMVYLFGFLADIVGSVLMFASLLPPVSSGNWWYENITNSVAFNPFENIYSFIYVVFATVISGVLIYFFNYKISFRKLEIEIKKKKQMAIALAVFTAPYLFFFPSKLFY